ncbi:hypothetical protein ACNSOP_08315 [Aliarcobacter lanthieri]|uniref:hypothetical protein n=1 Tax=Aliarcobacter lanthieri TaxID=1355374 RepID=UPI003AAAC93C
MNCPYAYQTELHIDEVIKSVNLCYSNEDLEIKKILVNLLRNESVLSEGKINNLISLKLIIRYFFKIVINKLFLIFNRKISAKTLIRSWVEDCLELYKEEMNINKEVVFLVYPFSINIKRQFNFIRMLKFNNYKYDFIGVNYSWIDYFSWIIKRDNIYLAILEKNAYLRHAKFLYNNYKFKELFTTDEFENSSFILHDYLRNRKIYTVNKAHGISKYCPYVSYDLFYVFNEAQKTFYYKFNKNIKYNIFNKNSKKKLYKVEKIVFVSQLSNNHASEFIKSEEEQILNELKKLNKTVYIKIHPNSKIKENENGEFIYFKNNINYLNEAIILTLYSTTYYTLSEYGYCYLVETRYNKPQILFGKNASIIRIEELLEFLKKHVY